MVFFLKKIFWFPMLLKKIFWFWWRKKKKSDSEFLSYNLMWNPGNKFAFCATKKINILTLVIFWTKQKTIPPCKLNVRSLNAFLKASFKMIPDGIDGMDHFLHGFNSIFLLISDLPWCFPSLLFYIMEYLVVFVLLFVDWCQVQ